MSNNNLKFFSGGTKIIFEIAISCSVHDGTHLLIFRCPSLHNGYMQMYKLYVHPYVNIDTGRYIPTLI